MPSRISHTLDQRKLSKGALEAAEKPEMGRSGKIHSAAGRTSSVKSNTRLSYTDEG